MDRRQMLVALAALASSIHLAKATADNRKKIPLHIIVPFPPGGGTDVLGRALGFRMEQILGQTAVIENKPGASGIVGAEYVAKTKPDGNTLLFSGLVPSVRYYHRPMTDIGNELAPVCTVAHSPYLIAVNPAVPAKSLKDLIEMAKKSPHTVTFGSPGNATPQHLATERFSTLTGIDMLHVPYRGTGPMMTDLLGGQIQLVFATIAAAEQHIKSGRLRALAVTSVERLERLPDVPTVSEAVLPDFSAEIIFGTYVAANTSTHEIAQLNNAVNQSLQDKEVRGKLLEQGFIPAGGTPADLEKRLVAEIKAVAELIRTGRVRIDSV